MYFFQFSKFFLHFDFVQVLLVSFFLSLFSFSYLFIFGLVEVSLYLKYYFSVLFPLVQIGIDFIALIFVLFCYFSL